MKKTGFTLAEVLITLSIIGIVAMMTLPALMTNVQEQQAKTGLKKGLNTVIEAAQMNQAIEGFDYGSLNSDAAGEAAQSMSGLLIQRTQIDTAKSSLDFETIGEGDEQTTQAATAAARAVDPGAANYVVFFRDGSALSYPNSITTQTNRGNMQVDGLPLGFVVLYDINGEKAPNRVSNCQSNANMLANAATDDHVVTATDTTAATATVPYDTDCPKAERVIKDQFLIRLRGSFAQPEGSASWWAYNH